MMLCSAICGLGQLAHEVPQAARGPHSSSSTSRPEVRGEPRSREAFTASILCYLCSGCAVLQFKHWLRIIRWHGRGQHLDVASDVPYLCGCHAAIDSTAQHKECPACHHHQAPAHRVPRKAAVAAAANARLCCLSDCCIVGLRNIGRCMCSSRQHG